MEYQVFSNINLYRGDIVKKLLNKSCIVSVFITEIAGIVSGIISLPGMKTYNEFVVKAPLTPPGWVFVVVWPVLYALMAIGACLVCRRGDARRSSCSLNLFVTQLIVNFFWTPIFFNTFAFGFSLAWILILWCLVLLMTVCFAKVSKFAACIQVPYIIWLSFAIYLNAAVRLLNR